MRPLEHPAFPCTEEPMFFLNLESNYDGFLWGIWKVGRSHQNRLKILHADKTLGNLPTNSLKEMEVNIRNALVGLFKSVGGLEMVTEGRKPGIDSNFWSNRNLALENPKALYDTEALHQRASIVLRAWPLLKAGLMPWQDRN